MSTVVVLRITTALPLITVTVHIIQSYREVTLDGKTRAPASPPDRPNVSHQAADRVGGGVVEVVVTDSASFVDEQT